MFIKTQSYTTFVQFSRSLISALLTSLFLYQDRPVKLTVAYRSETALLYMRYTIY